MAADRTLIAGFLAAIVGLMIPGLLLIYTDCKCFSGWVFILKMKMVIFALHLDVNRAHRLGESARKLSENRKSAEKY
jgi:hypothetical protein